MTLTQEEAHRLFEYKDGMLLWKIKPARRVSVGDVVGSRNDKGYQNIVIKGKQWGVHKVIFLMHHGYLPEVIDHVNGLPNDNRIQNLRAATQKKNNQNQRFAKHNTSGVKGVSFHKKTGKWRCSLSTDNKTKQVTCFASKDAAAEFMELWRDMAHGEFANHGINKETA